MQLFSPIWFATLVGIILIDLVLAVDNALAISLAARNLTPEKRNLAIWLGTGAGIAIRILAVFLLTLLEGIPGILLAGGVLLVYIGANMFFEGDHGKELAAPASLLSAIGVIVVADISMSVENVLALTAAAKGDMILVIVGILVAVPMLVIGSKVILRLIDRFPVVVKIGALALVSLGIYMACGDPIVKSHF
jgi:YjbE family integral membrane protein